LVDAYDDVDVCSVFTLHDDVDALFVDAYDACDDTSSIVIKP
jgi:hypothetical protein